MGNRLSTARSRSVQSGGRVVGEPGQVVGRPQRQDERPLGQADLNGVDQVLGGLVHPLGIGGRQYLGAQAQQVRLVDQLPRRRRQLQGFVELAQGRLGVAEEMVVLGDDAEVRRAERTVADEIHAQSVLLQLGDVAGPVGLGQQDVLRAEELEVVEAAAFRDLDRAPPEVAGLLPPAHDHPDPSQIDGDEGGAERSGREGELLGGGDGPPLPQRALLRGALAGRRRRTARPR